MWKVTYDLWGFTKKKTIERLTPFAEFPMIGRGGISRLRFKLTEVDTKRRAAKYTPATKLNPQEEPCSLQT